MKAINMRIVIIVFFFLIGTTSYAQHIAEDNIVGTTISIQSKIMNDEREIQIYLPASYSESTVAYPVLYILDGQRYFLHGVGLQKSFVEFKQAPEFIIVGISKNPSDRNRNYSVDSHKYLEFIETEIIDYVDSEFRTSNERILFGWAYGGGFVIETMITQSWLFDCYIAASPYPLMDRNNKIDSLLDVNPNFDRQLYFASGSNEGVVKEGTQALNELLISETPEFMNWRFRELEGEEHRSTPYGTLYHGMKEYFSYYPELQFSNLEEFTNAGGLEYVYDYYRQRATKFGFPKELSDWTMFSLTRNAMRAKDFKQFEELVSEFRATDFISRLRLSRACAIAEFYMEHAAYDSAIEIYEYLLDNEPEAVRPLIGLGDIYKELKAENKASFYYEEAQKISKNKAN